MREETCFKVMLLCKFTVDYLQSYRLALRYSQITVLLPNYGAAMWKMGNFVRWQIT